jgi:hypothetical protein
MSATELAVGGAWFALYAVAAGVAIRVWPQRSPAALVVALAWLFALALAPAGALAGLPANYWRALVAFCFFTLCYLMIFGATYKSISLRILLDLARAPSRRLSAEQILSRFVEQESFSARIDAMRAQGLAFASPDGLTLTPRGRRLAVATRLLHRLYRIERSG